MIYKCEKCNVSFDRRYVYEKHINRKTPCDRVVEPDPDAEFPCIHCGRSFSRKDVLTRHYTTCKMRNSKYSLSKIQKANVLENVGQAAIDSYNTNNTTTDNSTTNNITNNTHIHIHLPEVSSYDRQSISDLIHFIINNPDLKDDLDRLTSKISNYVKKNKPNKIFRVVLKFVHNNVLLPQGKNIFLGKGKLKDQFISKQPNGWSKTKFIRVLQTSLFTLIKLMKLVDIDPDDPNSKLCLEALNDNKKFSTLFGEVIEVAVGELDHSKKNPDIGELLKTIAGEEDLTKMIRTPELEKLYSESDTSPHKSDNEKLPSFDSDESESSDSSDSFITYVIKKTLILKQKYGQDKSEDYESANSE